MRNDIISIINTEDMLRQGKQQDCMLWLLLIGRTYLKEIERSMVMAKHIAVAGKGGTGKTTIASLIVRHLVADNREGSSCGCGSNATCLSIGY